MKPGTYLAKVVDSKLDKTNTGKERIIVVFQVTDKGEAFGELVSWHGYFTDATLDSTIKQIKVVGFEGSDIFNRGMMIGHEAKIVVVDEEYNGYNYTKVRWINSVKSTPKQLDMLDELTPQNSDGFRSRMRERLSGSDEMPF